MLSLHTLLSVSQEMRSLARQEILTRCPSFEAFWRQHLGDTPPFPPSSDIFVSGTAVTYWLLCNNQPDCVSLEIWGTRDQIDNWYFSGAGRTLSVNSLYLTSHSPTTSPANFTASRWYGSTWVSEVLSFDEIVRAGKTVNLEIIVAKENAWAAFLASNHSRYILSLIFLLSYILARFIQPLE